MVMSLIVMTCYGTYYLLRTILMTDVLLHLWVYSKGTIVNMIRAVYLYMGGSCGLIHITPKPIRLVCLNYDL